MRTSVKKNDPGYVNFIPGTIVLVDGKEAEHCHTADSDLGLAYCYEKGPDGKPFIDPDNPEQAKEIEIRGVVNIILPKKKST